jgi:transcriptional regulator with XRE-family HTH domain
MSRASVPDVFQAGRIAAYLRTSLEDLCGFDANTVDVTPMVGPRIKDLMDAKGWTSEQLAAMADLDIKVVNCWLEMTAPEGRLQEAKQLASVLGTTTDYLALLTWEKNFGIQGQYLSYLQRLNPRDIEVATRVIHALAGFRT